MIEVLKQTSKQVFVPLTIGGGIRDYTDKDGRTYSSLEVAAEYFRSGADKVSIGSDAVYIAEEYLKAGEKTGTSAIEEIARVYGSQAVVISVDPRRVYVDSPDATPHQTIENRLSRTQRGKILLVPVHGPRRARRKGNGRRDPWQKPAKSWGPAKSCSTASTATGTNAGFDLELIRAVRGAVTIPVIASSGAGCAEHFYEVFAETDAESAPGSRHFSSA